MTAQFSFNQLKKQLKAEHTRPYQARGILLKRCEQCCLSEFYCICNDIKTVHAACDFIVILHRNEVFKPTNSGKLIGNTFPENTYFFSWDRNEPAQTLLDLVGDSNRQCVIVFPLDQKTDRVEWQEVAKTTLTLQKKLTMILLDGTWRQARRMFNASKWLHHLPVLSLTPQQQAKYLTRKVIHKHYLSTAESTALALEVLEFKQESEQLLTSFDLFNLRYARMKKMVFEKEPS